MQDLSLRAKRLLVTQYEKLLVDERAEAKASAALTEIICWCDEFEFEPGRWIKSKTQYSFERQFIEQINQILLEDGFASIFENFHNDNHQSAAQRNPNEKQGRLKPTHHLILAGYRSAGY